MTFAIIAAIVSIAGLCVTLAVMLVRFGAERAELRLLVAELRKEVNELKTSREILDAIPLLQKDMEQVKRFASEWPRLEKRISYCEWNLDLEPTRPGMEPRPPLPRPRMPSRPRDPRRDEE